MEAPTEALRLARRAAATLKPRKVKATKVERHTLSTSASRAATKS
jgi:hypothetical protein